MKKPPDDPVDLGPRYRLIRFLGRGGAGAVYLVHDVHLGKDLAFKLLHRSFFPSVFPRAEGGATEEAREVEREFTVLSRLEHPGIARAYDFGYIAGRPYFTREFVPGEPLRAAEPTGPDETFDAARLVRISREAAEALGFLHENGLLHLDVKPANIVVPPDGGRAVLIDFGLCRRGFPAHAGDRLVGSLPYMAPEQFRGGPLGPATDLYALGVSLYRLATGRFPRAGGAAARSSGSPEDGWDPAPPPPSRLRPSLPPDLDRVALKCIALDASARFGSAAELLEALERLPGGRRRSSSGAGAFPRAAALVGRQAEISEVDRLLDYLAGDTGARSGGPTALLITAPPGMGLSRLLLEAKRRAQVRGIEAYLETGFAGRPGAPGSLLRCLGAHITGDDAARSRWEAFLERIARPRRPSRLETSEGERRLRLAGEVARAAAAVERPLLLAVDDLQLRDEVSLALLVDLVRSLPEPPLRQPSGEPARTAPPIGILAGFREGGAAAPLLRELVEAAAGAGTGKVLALGPLGFHETFELYRAARGESGTMRGETGRRSEGSLSALTVYARTGGRPASIVALAGAAEDRTGAGAARPEVESPALPGGEERSVFLHLALLERPARDDELSRIAGVPRRRLAAALAALAGRGLAADEPGERGREWALTPAARGVPLPLHPDIRAARR